MGLFSKKKKETTGRRPSSNSPSAPKVSSYYAPPTRTHSRPQIDMNKRGTKKPASAPKDRSLQKTAKSLLIASVLLFFGYNLLFLRHDPIVVMDRESSTGRLQVYEPAIANLLSKSIFNSNKVTLQAPGLEAQIIEEFPEIETAVVSSSLVGKRPVVHLYQQDLPFTIESKGKSYVITQNGVVAGEVGTFTGVDKTIMIRDESGVDVKKGTRVLRSDDAEFFALASDILLQKGREVELIRLTTIPREAYFKLKGLSYELRVFLDEPADTQIGTFFSAEKTLGERGELPGSYMDLRAGEKVFWQ